MVRTTTIAHRVRVLEVLTSRVTVQEQGSADWERRMRVACETVSSDELLTSASVVLDVYDTLGSLGPVLELAESLAEEYGLDQTVMVSSGDLAYTVRFYRRTSEPLNEDRSYVRRIYEFLISKVCSDRKPGE